jgi:phosphatidate cytidylyltransferase
VLRDRVLTAIVLVAALLAALFVLPTLAWTAVVAAVLAVAGWEWAGFVRAGRAARVGYALLIAALGSAIAYRSSMTAGGAGALALAPAYGIALAFWLIAVPIWLKLRPATPPAWLTLLAGIFALVPAFLALVQLRNMHPAMLLAFMATVWVADIAAYFVGRRYGRHKLAPHVSPGKTWEGVVGALVATAVYGLAWIALARDYVPAAVRDFSYSFLWMLLLVQALAVLAILGDLFESAMKRQAGLKDSGNLLPGHGGVLDRIDALLPVLPAAALVSLV